MSMMSRFQELFPASRAEGGQLYLKTRDGIVAGRITHMDDTGLVIDTGRGIVFVLKRALVAISDRRDALEGWRKPNTPAERAASGGA
jgi:hypothetical protein